jgi:uncharacterized protein (DUF2336 family)
MPTPISSSIAQLAALARGGSLDLQQLALRVKADLLLSTANPPDADLAAFDEMAQSLIPIVDEETAVALARRLADWPHVPPAVLAALRQRGGAVLAALLRHGMAVTQAELEAYALGGAEPILTACAARGDLGETVVRMLCGACLRGVDLALCANRSAPLPADCIDQLVARARRDPGLAAALLERPGLQAGALAPLFPQADADRRAAMLDALAQIEAVAPSERIAPLPPDTMAGWIETACVDPAGAYGAIDAALTGGSGLADDLAADEDRELTALALLAAGASAEDAIRFLIRLGDAAAHSVERIFALAALMRAVRPAVARRLVKLIAGTAARPVARSGEHMPAMDPSGTPSRAAPAAAADRGWLGQMMRPRAGQRR